jgi:endonuclease/exonuclease/phosphatase family metal-dependent hydrolase
MRMPRLIAAALGLCALSAGLLAPASAVQASGASVRALTFNICGNICRKGETLRTSENLARQIALKQPTVVFLQEVCYSQFLALQSRIVRAGYSATFVAASRGGHCDLYDKKHGEGFGIALAVKGTFTGRTVRWLPSPSIVKPERRALLGVTAKIGGRSTFVATTHTAPGGPNLEAQLGAISFYLAVMSQTRPVIVGGDFNSLPDNPGLDNFYSDLVPDGHGPFREMDDTDLAPGLPTCRCGEESFDVAGRKIDYVFASRDSFEPVTANTDATGYSDHRLYYGTYRTK